MFNVDITFNTQRYHIQHTKMKLLPLLFQVCVLSGRCARLAELSLVKCDRLTEQTLRDVFLHCTALTNFKILGSLNLRQVSTVFFFFSLI